MSEQAQADQPAPQGMTGPQSWLSTLERASAILALAVFVCYVIGFLVVNSRLFAYGFYEYGVFRPRYIAAGLLLFLYVAPGFPVYTVLHRLTIGMVSGSVNSLSLRQVVGIILKRMFTKRFLGTVLIAVTTSAGLMLTLSLGLWFLGDFLWTRFVEFGGWRYAYRLDYYLINSLLWGAAMVVVWASLDFAFTRLFLVRAAPSLFAVMLAIAFVSLWAISLPAAFGHFIYSAIWPNFGGGRVIPVILVTDEPNRSVLARLVPLQTDLPAQGDAPASEVVVLLDETDDSYLILADTPDRRNYRAIRVRKEWVKALVQVKEIPNEWWLESQRQKVTAPEKESSP